MITSRFPARSSLVAILATTVLGLAGPPMADAAKSHCRSLTLGGDGASESNKPVTFYIKNQIGNQILAQSCPITTGDGFWKMPACSKARCSALIRKESAVS